MSAVFDRLDDLVSLDPKGMYRLTIDFPKQCRRALQIAASVDLKPLERQPDVVILSGMGGSASGGDFIRALFEAQGKTPMIVNRDYRLPSYLSASSLVFAVSYSGNTEETLSAYYQAKQIGARTICVTSGGELAQRARQNGDTLFQIDPGQPPRTAFGYVFFPVLDACERLNLLPKQNRESAISLLERLQKQWGVEATEGNEAKKLAELLHGRLSVLYGLGSWQGLVANRWRCQINENAKNLAFANSFPELNHNEILGWVKSELQGLSRFVAVVLQDGTEDRKMKTRAAVTERLIRDKCDVVEAIAQGETLLERMLTLSYMGDFVSLYLARLNNVDPENIDSINTLKEELGKS